MEIEKYTCLNNPYYEDLYNTHKELEESFRRYASIGEEDEITDGLIDRKSAFVSCFCSSHRIPYNTARKVLLGDFSDFQEGYKNYRELKNTLLKG